MVTLHAAKVARNDIIENRNVNNNIPTRTPMCTVVLDLYKNVRPNRYAKGISILFHRSNF